jgi:hypothetical protein
MARPIIFDKDAALRQGIAKASSAFGKALATNAERKYLEDKRQRLRQEKEEDAKKYGSILQNTIGQLGDDSSNIDFVRAYTEAINQGLPIEMAQNMSTLQKALREPPNKAGLGIENEDNLVSLLTSFGIPEEQAEREAKLYMALPTGGKTQYANMFFDRMQRGGFDQQPQTQSGQIPNFQGIPGEIVDSSQISLANTPLGQQETQDEEEYKFPKLDLFEGLTPKERVHRQKDLFNANAKEYAEITQKGRGFGDELRRLEQMERLNNSGKLPTGLERLNINWTTGDIRFPAAANAETQLFVKSVNDFTTKAKEVYGARVTNFELSTFMRRLPTLANTEEGRRLILDQMRVNAELEKLHQDSLKEVYDHYGLRGVDSQQAEKLAGALRKDAEEALEKKKDQTLEIQKIYEARQKAPEGKMPARSPTGEIVYIWTDQLEKAAKKGYEIL